jgi:hypothetical protein
MTDPEQRVRDIIENFSPGDKARLVISGHAGSLTG